MCTSCLHNSNRSVHIIDGEDKPDSWSQIQAEALNKLIHLNWMYMTWHSWSYRTAVPYRSSFGARTKKKKESLCLFYSDAFIKQHSPTDNQPSISAIKHLLSVHLLSCGSRWNVFMMYDWLIHKAPLIKTNVFVVKGTAMLLSVSILISWSRLLKSGPGKQIQSKWESKIGNYGLIAKQCNIKPRDCPWKPNLQYPIKVFLSTST